MMDCLTFKNSKVLPEVLETNVWLSKYREKMVDNRVYSVLLDSFWLDTDGVLFKYA